MLNSRNLRFLHRFGTAIALLSLGLLAVIGSRFIQQNQTPPAWLFATIFAVVVYIVHAYRRTNALAKEEANSRIDQANQAFNQLGPEELSAGVSLRWGVKAYVLCIVVLALTSAGIVLGWIDRWWLLLGFCSVWFFFVLKALLKSLAHPIVLRIGPNGIEDYFQYGLILWKDIENVSLHKYESRGVTIESLLITVREPQAYSQRLGKVRRFLLRTDRFMIGPGLRITLYALNKEPLVVFKLVQSFHERNVPPGAIHGSDTFYFVNLELAKLQSELNEFGLTFNKSALLSTGWPQGSSQPEEPQR